MTALHSKSPLKNSMTRISYNGLNQPNFLLKVKKKMCYITGAKSELNSNDPRYELWDEETLMVMPWLLHSMQLEISQT